jgi:hypothetical protein
MSTRLDHIEDHNSLSVTKNHILEHLKYNKNVEDAGVIMTMMKKMYVVVVYGVNDKTMLSFGVPALTETTVVIVRHTLHIDQPPPHCFTTSTPSILHYDDDAPADLRYQ